jgi:hypothetical protein
VLSSALVLPKAIWNRYHLDPTGQLSCPQNTNYLPVEQSDRLAPTSLISAQCQVSTLQISCLFAFRLP